MGSLQSQLTSLTSSFSGVSGAAGPVGIAIGLIATATIGAAAGLASLTLNVTEQIDAIGDMADKVNFSVRTISGLGTAIEAAGSDTQSFVNALGILDKNLEAAAQGDKRLSTLFKALKIDVNDNEAAFRQIAKVLMELGGTGQQTALAMELFGKSGKDVVGIIKAAGGDVEQFIQQMERAGFVIGDDAVTAADALDKQIIMLRAQIDSLTRQIGVELIPVAQEATRDMSTWLTQNQGDLRKTARELATVTEWVYKLSKAIIESNPNIIFIRIVRSVTDFEGASNKEAQESFPIDAAGVSSAFMRVNESRGDDAGEFAIAGGAGQFSAGSQNAPPTKGGKSLADRIRELLARGSGGAGGKSPKDALKDLESGLVSLNAEFRKLDVALLGSANSSAVAAEKEKILSGLMAGLKTSTRLAISELTDIDEAIDKAIGSLPAKSQAAAKALVAQSLAQFKQNEQLRIGAELNKKAEEMLQGWRLEIDNSRTGADSYTLAIQDLEKAFAKYGQTLDRGTRAELEHVAAMARAIEKTKELTRARIVGDRPRRVSNTSPSDVLDLGGGSFVMEGGTGEVRDRLATLEDQLLHENIRRRQQQMQQVAEDLSSFFGDAFDSIGRGWDSLWNDMLQTARNISRRIVEDLVTATFSKAFNVPFESRSGGIVGLITNGILNRRSSSGSGSFGGAGSAAAGAIAGARATGGPVEAGMLYRVNEYRQEFFRPNTGGQVIPLGPQQQSSSPMRIGIFDDRQRLNEWRPDRVLKASKQMRKIGKLVPGF